MIEAVAVVLLSIASPDDRLVESLQKCREIEDEVARLECFDEAFIPADEGVEGSSETESSTGSWTVDAETNPADGSTTAIAVIPAEGGKRQHGQSVDLVVSCDDGELSVYIDWGQYLGSEAPAVTVRIDSLPPSRSNWTRSEDKHASLLRPAGGKKARQQKIASFVRDLIAGQRLAARVIPRGQTAVTAKFDLSGAKAALRTAHRACTG